MGNAVNIHVLYIQYIYISSYTHNIRMFCTYVYCYAQHHKCCSHVYRKSKTHRFVLTPDWWLNHPAEKCGGSKKKCLTVTVGCNGAIQEYLKSVPEDAFQLRATEMEGGGRSVFRALSKFATPLCDYMVKTGFLQYVSCFKPSSWVSLGLLLKPGS